MLLICDRQMPGHPAREGTLHFDHLRFTTLTTRTFPSESLFILSLDTAAEVPQVYSRTEPPWLRESADDQSPILH